MAKTHKVACKGVMKINGKLAFYGEEVGRENFDLGDIKQFDGRVQDGYIETKEDFDKRVKASNLSEDQKKQLAIENQKKADEAIKKQQDADALKAKAHDALLADYKKAFEQDAPAEVSDEAIKAAIDSKTAILIP